MIIAHLQGGIGNKLFQIAASIGTAEIYEKEWKVEGDFPAEHFSIPKERLVDSYQLPRYKEPNFHYDLPPDGDYFMDGYFQSVKYFRLSQKLIRTLFECPYSEKIKWKYRDLLDKNTCAVHVRRGDYLTLSDYHYNLELEYYETAMKRMKLLAPSIHFVCFSDDIQWCKENVKADTFIDDDSKTKTFLELHLMSYCKHFIIANSTYSWWGQWLSRNPEKIVIAPPKAKHFGPKNKDKIVDDYYESNWIYEK